MNTQGGEGAIRAAAWLTLCTGKLEPKQPFPQEYMNISSDKAPCLPSPEGPLPTVMEWDGP